MSRTVVLILCIGLVAGCMEGQKPQEQRLQRAAAKQSLYERLGGEPGLTRVVDDFVAIVVADPRIKEVHKKHFREGDVAGLKRKLIDQVGEATGGPQKYKGKNMKEAHRGLGISDEDFDALVACLIQALDKNQVGQGEKDELLALLGPMRADVVEKPQ